MAKLCDFNRKEEILIKKTFLHIGTGFAGKDYVINQNNSAIITDLLKYFTGNGDLDMRKGIYLFGNFGVGKTIIFHTIRKLLSELFPFSPNGFAITSIEQIIEMYKFEKSLLKFGYNKDDLPVNLCINEFGKKMSEKIYGTDVNSILESLFMIRYELFQKGKLTHVTSNYNPAELDLPDIIKDRMVEMFNFIEIKGDSFRE